jgi:ABC-type transporter Mla subunit MlaD
MTTQPVTSPPTIAAASSGTAAGLRDLAGEPRLSPIAADLGALAQAVDPAQKKDVHRWAGVDLFSAFLREDTVGPPRQAWTGRVLDIWVQTLFFVPIFLTWLGLMEATGAYQQALKVKGLATEPFLAGWQSGFNGHLDSLFYLDHIALYVVVVIAILVASMMIQSVYHNRVDEDEPARLRQALARLLTAVELELAPVRLSSPDHIVAELHNAITGFSDTAAEIREVGKIAQRTQSEAASGMAAATNAITEVNGLTKNATTAATNVDKAAQSIGKLLPEIKSTADEMVAAEKRFAQQIGQHSTKLSDSTNGLSSKIKDAVEGNQKLMSTAIEGSSAKITKALDTGADQIRSALAEITVAGGQYTHQVEQAADVLGLAGEAVDKLPGVVGDLQQRVSEAGHRVEQLGQAIIQARTVLPSAADIPGDLRSALAELSAAATALQAASAAFRDGTRPWLPPLPPPSRRRWTFGSRGRP